MPTNSYHNDFFFPSNSLIHLTSLHPRYSNGNSSSLLGQFKIYQPERCMINISIFPFFCFLFQNNCPRFTHFASSSGYILGVWSIRCQWRHSCVSVYLYNIQLNTGMCKESRGISWSKEFALLHSWMSWEYISLVTINWIDLLLLSNCLIKTIIWDILIGNSRNIKGKLTNKCPRSSGFYVER